MTPAGKLKVTVLFEIPFPHSSSLLSFVTAVNFCKFVQLCYSVILLSFGTQRRVVTVNVSLDT